LLNVNRTREDPMRNSKMLAAVTAETAMPQPSRTTNESASGKNFRWLLKALFCCLSVYLLMVCAPVAAAQTGLGTVAVGSNSSKSVSVSYTGTSASVAAVTQGAASKDFTVGSASCSASPCSVTVTFAPKYSGERFGALVVYDSGGNALGTTYLTGYGQGPQLTFTSNPAALGKDGVGTTLQGVAVDGAGIVYITDSSTGALYKLVPTQSDIEHVYWSQSTIVNGCGSTATTDCFASPQGVAVDGAGNLYVADAGNSGSVSPGVYKMSLLDNGTFAAPVALPAPSGGWQQPGGIAVDGAGNVYVANNGTGQIYQLNPSGSSYSSPSDIIGGTAVGIAADSAGNVYVARNDQVYKYTASESYGTGRPVYWSSTDNTVAGVAVDGNGNVFISDSVNRIKEATPVSGGVNATSYNAATPLNGDVFSSAALTLDGAGNIYAVNAAGQGGAGTLFFYEQSKSWGGYSDQYAWGTVNSTENQITNDGNQPLTLSGVDTSVAPDFQFVQTGTAFTNLCTTSTPLAAGASCNLEIDFDPLFSSLTANPTYLWENVTLTTNATPDTATLAMQGIEMPVSAFLMLTSSPNSAQTGVPITLTATIINANSQQEPAGTVSFYINGTADSGCGAVTPSNGRATCVTTFASAGPQSVQAYYSGDAYYNYNYSNIYALSVVVPPAATAPGVTTFGTTAAPIAVGASTSGSVTFTFGSAVTLHQIQALTQGATGQEFTVASGGSCAAGSSYGPSGTTTCTVNVTFTPAHPGTRNGAVTLSDASNNVVATAYLQGFSTGAQVAIAPASSLYTSTATASGIYSWGAVAVDGAGNLFAAENEINNNGGSVISEMKPSVTGGTLSYSQTKVYSTGSDGTGTNSSFDGVAVDGEGNLYFIVNNQLYLLPRLADGTYPAYTAAVHLGSECGNGITANCWVDPIGVAVDGAGSIYVADNDNNGSAAAIYKLTLTGGVYSAPVALPVPSGGYSELNGVAVDGAGNVYALNESPAAIYESKWSGTAYSTPAAITVDGSTSFLNNPESIAADGLGNVYVADYGWGVIQLSPNGSGYSQVTLANPSASSQVAVDASGSVYLTSFSSLTVYSATTPAALSFGSLPVDGAPGSQSVKVVSTGNAALDLTSLSFPADFPSFASDTTCSASSVLTQGQSCSLYIEFAPTVASLSATQPLAEDVTITSNATPATVTIPISGTAVKPTPQVTLVDSANPIVTGTSATLTATMSTPEGSSGLAMPTGTVSFSAGSTTLCSAVALQSGVATCATTPSTAGTFTVQAAYSGDSLYLTNTASVTVSVVNPPDAIPSSPVTSAGAETVGSSGTAVVTINFSSTLTAPVTMAAINVLTQGAPNLDFTLAATQAATGACATGKSYAASASCTVTVTFKPKFSGPRFGAVVLMDNSSPANVVATAYLTGTGNGPQGVFLPGTLSAPLTDSSNLWDPEGVAVDGAGNLYIADESNDAVYEMTLSGGVYSAPAVIAGSNLYFGSPESVAVDGAGNLYVADSGDGSGVYLFTLQPDGSYTQTTLGTGWQYPSGVAVDGSGDVYVADNGSQSVVELTPSNGAYTQTTVASSLSNPWGVAVDTSGNVYVANNGNDGRNATVLKLTLAGTSYTQSMLGSGWRDPKGIAVDGNGNVYVADDGEEIVAKLTLQTDGSYTQTTLKTGDLDEQEGVALDGAGNLYVVDSDYTDVYKIDLADPPLLAFNDTALGWTSSDSPQTITYANIGNQPLTLSALSYATDFPEASPSPSGACTGSTALAANAGCKLSIDFTPITAQSSYPQTLSEYASLTSDAINVTGAQQISLAGSVMQPAVRLALTSSLNPTWVGGAAPTFSVTITIPSSTMPAPGGTVSFFDPGPKDNNTTPICDSIAFTAVSGSTTTWTASCTPSSDYQTNYFQSGVNPIFVDYSGDTYYTGGRSNTVNEYVAVTAPPTGNFNDTSIGSANVGSSVTCLPLTIAFNTTETLGGIQVLTGGASNGDFSQGTSCAAPSGSLKSASARPMGATGSGAALCAVGTQYSQGDSCVVNVNFTPSFAGTRYGAVLLTDTSTPANIIGTGYLEGTGIGSQTIFTVPTEVSSKSRLTDVRSAQSLTALTPLGTNIVSENVALLPGSQSTIGSGWFAPQGVAVDGANNVYIADPENSLVVKETYSKTNGVVSYTSSNLPPPSVDGGSWGNPTGVAVDGAGNVYVADSDHANVVMETLQPDGSYAASIIDNVTHWREPAGIAVDGAGNVYVADNGMGFVIKETLSDGVYMSSTVDNQHFDCPSGLAVDGLGNIFVTDRCNSAVAKETLQSDGSYTIGQIGSGWGYPIGIAVDDNSNVYIADPEMGEVVMEALSNGKYTATQIGDFGTPYGLALTPSGNLIVADAGENIRGVEVRSGNTLVAAARFIQKDLASPGSSAASVYFLDFADPPVLSFATTAYQATSTDSPQTVVVDNFGNAQLNFSALAYPSDFTEASGVTTDCTATSQVAANGSCMLSIAFTPVALSTTSLSTLLSENVSLTTNALNTTDAQQVAVSGTETQSELEAATPVFSTPSGILTSAQTTIYLTDATSGAAIRYTTDGSTPSASSTLYTTAGIVVSSSETIKAIAIATNYNNSAVATAAYTINIPSNPTAATPTFSPAAGSYTSAQTVYLSDTTSGAVLYYTTDGSTPSPSSTLYTTAGIVVSSSETIKAIAVASDYNNSAVATAAYTINSSTSTGDFTISASDATFTVEPGGSGVYTLTVTPANGASTFPATVNFSVSGLPPGATVTFSPASIATGAGTTTVTMTIYNAQLAAANHPSAGGALVSRLAPLSLALLLLPFAGLLRKSGKRLSRLFTVLLLLGAALAGLNGCGTGAGFFGHAQKTYTVTVTATMGTVSHTSNVTITVE
jgi:DNA-binding beta-propeller fold protein YncE